MHENCSASRLGRPQNAPTSLFIAIICFVQQVNALAFTPDRQQIAAAGKPVEAQGNFSLHSRLQAINTFDCMTSILQVPIRSILQLAMIERVFDFFVAHQL